MRPELVRQPGVRIARDPRRRDARDVLDERPHLGRTERAVHADDERLRLLDRDPEGLDRLPGQVAAAAVDCGERQPQRHLGRRVARGDDGRLRVQGVEDRLDEEQVDTAVAQRGHLLRVRLDHLIEGDRAIRRVLHLRRQRQRDVERADGAGDEAAVLVGDLARDARSGEAHLGGVVLERIVGLADARGGEGVGRGDVRAGLEVRPVDVAYDLGPRQVEQVGVAGDIARVVAEAVAAVGVLPAHLALDEHAPRPVEHGNALAEDRFEFFACAPHPSPLPPSGPGAPGKRPRAL